MNRRLVSLALAAALLPAALVAVPGGAVAAPVLAAPVVAATSTVAAAAPSSVAVGGAAKAKKYKNCTALNKAYRGGVARDSKAVNTKTVRGKKVKAASTYRPKISKALYTANKGLDRDKDGIACEK
ncbi:excalibur calcium-binding domain-containing protein [Flavimobilis sp. GY10621]|uniref:Excalibur calcium-binding domain-containing protein n=1 Tax=Flavimobilis rhizosphaerae TaxID=2775421 RepID=A0ABR9DLH8_9MICO|nr:excalibur calcium-binding domain-containing protein [Flavimobilis rhizosphaerae]MBD9698002.1 excalibur calcium-binding domain-containing protein [Flavimobilis rhizosphaerae]